MLSKCRGRTRGHHAGMARTGKILFTNGEFWTGSTLLPRARHVTSSGGRIASVGAEQPPDLRPDLTIDLKGRFAMPGFIDAHTHFRAGGASLKRLDLRGSRSKTEFAEMVLSRARANHDGRWLVGVNWDNESWADKSFPSKELIDDFTQSFPVFLDRVDTHMALVNSEALRIVGISRDTPDPRGGVVLRDGRGEPTGIVKDAARELVMRHIPKPSQEELMSDARAAMRLANSLGVTSVSDIGPDSDLMTYIRLKMRDEMTVRVNMILPISDYETLVDGRLGLEEGENEWISLTAVKAFADGSLGAGTAWFHEPYEDDNSNRGIPTDILASGELEEYALDADKNHIQLAIHAIGDMAVSRVLDIFDKVEKSNRQWERRFRIEHAQHISPDDFARMKRLKAVASVQPYHCIDDGRWAERKIGRRRAESAFPFRRFLDEEVALSFGTDWPVAPLNPLDGIFAAVTRSTLDGMNSDGWIPGQKLNVEEALTAYTYGSAYASFAENEKGKLEPGKLADIVVLSASPFDVPPEKIKDIRVLMTVVGGRIVYSDATAFPAEGNDAC